MPTSPCPNCAVPTPAPPNWLPPEPLLLLPPHAARMTDSVAAAAPPPTARRKRFRDDGSPASSSSALWGWHSPEVVSKGLLTGRRESYRRRASSFDLPRLEKRVCLGGHALDTH